MFQRLRSLSSIVKGFSIGIFAITVGFSELYGQTPTGQCDNLGFVDGNLDDWIFKTGCHPNAVAYNMGKFATFCHRNPNTGCCDLPANFNEGNDNAGIGIKVARQTKMGGPGSNIVDKFGNFNVVPPEISGYPKSEWSVRLGNAWVYGEADQMERTFQITEDNAIFAYQFAFVLNDPTENHDKEGGAPYWQLPFFEAGIFKDGNPLDCSHFIILANDPDLTVLSDVEQDSINGGRMTVRYKEWTPIFMDLTDYIGQSLTLKFKNADCARAGHWGYSYVSAFCGPYVPMTDVEICPGGKVTLKSPFPLLGFELEWWKVSPAPEVLVATNVDSIVVQPGETTKYELRVKNRAPFQKVTGNCTKTYPVTITVGEGLPPVLEDTTLCPGDITTLFAKPGGVEYEWYKDSVGGDPFHTGDKYTTDPVFEEVTYYVVNPAECAPKDRIPVKIKLQGISIDAGEDQALCVGGTVQLNATGGAETYQWEPETYLDNARIANPKSTPLETITYIVTGKSGNCEAKDTITIKVGELIADAGPDAIICLGDSAQLNGSGGDIYSWAPPTGLSATNIPNPKASPPTTTTYTVTVKDEAGLCEGTDIVTVKVEEINANFEGIDVCINFVTDFANLTTPADLTNAEWLWNFGDGGTSTEKQPSHTYTAPGTYKVLLSVDAGTCKDTFSTEVIVHPNPIAAFTPTPRKTTADDPLITFIDESEGAARGTWNYGDGAIEDYVTGENKVHVYYATNEGEGPFKYTIVLSVESEYGCKDEVSHPIEIENIWTIYVPNSFTPDGDGVNDYFKAYGIGIIDFKMNVYNRWGEVVFRSNNINEGWDGTPISGSHKKQEVYVWKVKATNNRGKVIKLIGHVSLLPRGPGDQ